MTYFHYTCRDHGLPGIRANEELYPHPLLRDPALPALVWLTDLPHPNREGLGLTSHVLACDRTEVRITVPDHSSIQPWWKWRRAHPELGDLSWALQSAPGARPAHWFVAPVALPLNPLELP